MTAVVLDQADAHGSVRRRLQPAIDRRVDPVAGALRRGAEALAYLQARHLRYVGRLDIERRGMLAREHRLLVGRIGGLRVYVPELAHPAQHVGAPSRGHLRAHDRVVARRGLRHAGQRCRLRDAELVEGLAEEGFGRRRHSIGALAEEDLVQVEAEDLLLGEFTLHLVGDEGLLQLAADRLVERQKHVAGGLHRDRARPLRLLARHQVDEHGTHHAGVVDAVMLEEAVVLGGEEGMLHQLRDLLVGDRIAALLADLGDQPAAAGVDPQGHLHLDAAHRLGGRQRGLQIDEAARQGIAGKKCDQHHTCQQQREDPKVLPFHRIQLSWLALPTTPMHSSRRLKGKLTERWGRKASGLRDTSAYDSGVAGSNVN